MRTLTNNLAEVLRAAKPRRHSSAAKVATLRIETMRPALEADETPTGWEHAPTIGKLATIASVRPEKAALLFAAVEKWRPGRILELGTCCGVSGAYMQCAAPTAAFRSLELSPVAAATAQNLWARLGLGGEVVVGDFADTFEAALDPLPDVAFVDGNHHEDPTLAYFEALAMCKPGSLLIFDDVDWSDGMKRVWARIKSDVRVETAEAARMGFAVLQ